MPTSDDEYGLDDLVLDDHALAVLDATERSLAAVVTSKHRPRSSPEQQPSKRLKTDHQGVQLQGQPRERSLPSNSKRLTKATFSLEDTDLPEITISNSFYSGPGRFFVGSQQSEAPESPNPHQNNCESVGNPDSDVILLSVSTEQQIHAPERDTVATPNNSNSRIPSPRQSSLVPQFSRERNTSTDVLPSSGNHPLRHFKPGAPSTRPLVRASSFNDAMRAALRNAISEVDRPAPQCASSTMSSDTPPLLSVPRAYSQRQIPTQTQATTDPGLNQSSRSQYIQQSIPPRQQSHPPRQSSLHGPHLARVSEIPTQCQPTLKGGKDPSPIEHMNGFRGELESLKSQVEELKRENAEQQQSLDRAFSEKRDKMGEVEILRANLQKISAAHGEETAKLRTAKENLEAAQIVAQKKQDAELERLRTQLIFKQHELQASRRAAPRTSAPSQVVGSSQIHRSDVPVTHPTAQNPSPRRSVTLAPHPPKAHPPLPGFVNTFAIPPPKRGKGKAHIYLLEKSQDVHDENWELPLPSPSSSPTRAPLRTKADERIEMDRDESDGQAGVTTYPDVDYCMESVDDARTLGHISGPSRSAKPFDWLGWIRQLLLAHATSPSAPTTMQLLLGQPLLYGDHTSAFSSACTSLMDAVAASPDGYGPVARIIANSLTQIVDTLLRNIQLKSLIPTLNLLGVLVISLPSFAINLLKPIHGPSLLQTICTIIVNLLQPSDTNNKEPERAQERAVLLDLASEVFCLLDAVIYALPPEFQPELALIPQTPNVLATMLSKSQPTALLENSTRTLSYLSIRTGIFRSLLSFSEDTPESVRNFTNLPQVDRMCALLMDLNRTSAEGNSICASVLTTLISLAMAHEDALTILSESPFFIPSLVALLAELSTVLWEEDPELTKSTMLLSQTVAMVGQGILLLHYVIFRTPKGPANLRGRLQAAPPRHFNGIGHQFVVALGRLSFAEPPDEVSASDRMLLEQLADPARDVMDLVVAGPESESVWSLFQEEDTNDEERDDDGERGAGGHTFEDDEDVVMVL